MGYRERHRSVGLPHQTCVRVQRQLRPARQGTDSQWMAHELGPVALQRSGADDQLLGREWIRHRVLRAGGRRSVRGQPRREPVLQSGGIRRSEAGCCHRADRLQPARRSAQSGDRPAAAAARHGLRAADSAPRPVSVRGTPRSVQYQQPPGVQSAGIVEFQRRQKLREHYGHAQHAASDSARREGVLVRSDRRIRLLLPLVLVAVARAGALAQPPKSPKSAPRKPAAVQASRPSTEHAAAVERRLLKAVRGDPDSFEAQYQLASFYLQQGKLQEALPYLQRARAIDATNEACGHDLALALLEMGKLDEARTLITSMMGSHETGELHNLLGNVEERAGDFAGADREYEQAAHMAPTEEHLFDWGNNLLQLQAFEDAMKVFTPAIARHPQSARLHVGLGIAQYSRGQYEDAVTSFCQAADLAPSDPRPYQFLGEMYGVVPALSGEITVRLARFANAHPRNALAQFHYAMSLWKGQAAAPADLRQVEALLRRAVTLDGKLAKGFLELGILLSDEQRYKEAILQLQHA